MRIHLVTRQIIWGGGETFLLATAQAFAARGHVVSLGVPAHSMLATKAVDLTLTLDSIRVPADMIVCNDFHSLRRHAMFWSSGGLKFVVHGWWQTSVPRNLFARLANAELFAASNAVRTAIIQHGFYASRDLGILPIGPDHSRFRPPTTDERAAARAHFGFASADCVFVFIGRLQDIKRPALAINATREARARGLIVTPSPTNAEEHALATSIRRATESDPSLLWKVDGNPREALWAADVFLNTSEFESLGIAMMEAMACGIPVVTTARGGVDDFLFDGESGYICRGDVGLLSERLKALRSDQGLRQKLGRNAILRVKDRTYERVAVMLGG